MQEKSFLERIQTSDSATKWKWVIGSTAVAVVLIVIVWLSYFNSLVAYSGDQDNQSSFSFGDTMRTGTAILYQNMSGGLKDIANIFNSSRTYEVAPQNGNQ